MSDTLERLSEADAELADLSPGEEWLERAAKLSSSYSLASLDAVDRELGALAEAAKIELPDPSAPPAREPAEPAAAEAEPKVSSIPVDVQEDERGFDYDPLTDPERAIDTLAPAAAELAQAAASVSAGQAAEQEPFGEDTSETSLGDHDTVAPEGDEAAAAMAEAAAKTEQRPSFAADDEDEEQTVVLDANAIEDMLEEEPTSQTERAELGGGDGGLDMDALFDGVMDESAAQANYRPSSLPPPVPAGARKSSGSPPPSDAKASDEDFEMMIDEDLVEEDAGEQDSEAGGEPEEGEGGEKKGFFKKLFG